MPVFTIKGTIFPGVDVNVLPIKRFSNYFSIPRRGVKINDISMTIYENEDMDTTEFIAVVLNEFPADSKRDYNLKDFPERLEITMRTIRRKDFSEAKVFKLLNPVIKNTSDLQFDDDNDTAFGFYNVLFTHSGIVNV